MKNRNGKDQLDDLDRDGSIILDSILTYLLTELSSS
jgi:hypothetical protein